MDYRFCHDTLATVFPKTSAIETPQHDVSTDKLSALGFFTAMRRMFAFSSTTAQTDWRCLHPATWFLFLFLFFLLKFFDAGGQIHARLPCYDLSQLCREPVCGRQLSQKLVTVQPPTYQPNGLFICPRAMHYGWEQSPLIPPILSHSVFNAAEENCLIPAEIKPMLQSTCAHAHTCMKTVS